MTLAALVLLAAGLSSPSASEVDGHQDRPQRPADVDLPAPPSALRGGKPRLPRGRSIERNTALADRFVTEGQRVNYSFEAREGELSVFDLGIFGYSRGWSSTASVQILDASRRPLVEELREGGAAYRHFLCFTAPRDGTYVYSLAARRESFRYILVRHSDFRVPRPGDVRRLGGGGVIHGYLAGPEDRALFEVDLKRGQVFSVLARNSGEEAQREFRTRTAGARGGDPRLYPTFQLAIRGDQASKRPSHFALYRAPSAGTYTIEVGCPRSEVGGLFDLSFELDPVMHRVEGIVVDPRDVPVPGVSLSFVRDPDREPMGVVTTGADGTYAIRVPPGPYRISLRKAGGKQRILETNVRGAREINAIY